MAEFLQQNWIGILFVVAMMVMHLGGHRHAGQSGGHGGHGGGCGAGHPGHPRATTDGHEGHQHQQPAGRTHDNSRRGQDTVPMAQGEVPRGRDAASGPAMPDPTRDAINPDDNPLGPDVPPWRPTASSR